MITLFNFPSNHYLSMYKLDKTIQTVKDHDSKSWKTIMKTILSISTMKIDNFSHTLMISS